MKYRKSLIIFAVFLSVFIIALAYQKIRRAVVESKIDKSEEERQEQQQTNTTGNNQPIFPLTYGSGMGGRSNARPQVKRLQQALNTLVPASLTVDGQWGNNTQKCVNLLRSKYSGILPDGSVSASQLEALEQQAINVNSTPAELRQTEIREGDDAVVSWSRSMSGWGPTISK